MFWSVVTGALIMLMGILIGAAIAMPRKDGFQLLLEEIKKMNETNARIAGFRVKICPHCKENVLGKNLAQLDEEYDHHIQMKHAGLEPQVSRCLTCGMTFVGETWEEALGGLNRHIEFKHPEHLPSSKKTTREIPPSLN